MGRLDVSHEIVVSAPVERVYAYMTNLDNYPKFVESNEEIRGHSGPLGDGDTWQSVSRFMGQEIVSNNRLVELTAPNLFRYATNSNVGEMESSWEFQPVDGGTRITLAAGGELKGFLANIALGLLKRRVDKQFKDDMGRLEQILNGESE